MISFSTAGDLISVTKDPFVGLFASIVPFNSIQYAEGENKETTELTPTFLFLFLLFLFLFLLY